MRLASERGLTKLMLGQRGHVNGKMEAAQTAKRSPEFAASYQAIARRRGKKIATIAISRKLLTRAYHLLAEQATGTPGLTTPRLLRSAVRDPLLVNCISLATPFAAYLLGEDLHVSGVLAVAVAGLMIGHDTPRFTSGASRLQASAVWHLADFLIQGFVFLLVGQQIAAVVRGLRAYPAATITTAAIVSLGVVLLLRPLWLVLTQSLPHILHTRRRRAAARDDQHLTGREVVVLSWAGTRGVISLAAIFTLPLVTGGGRPFPGRDLLLFCTYLVVVATLIGQGVTFAPLARALGVRADPADAVLLRGEARCLGAGRPVTQSCRPHRDMRPRCRLAGPSSTHSARNCCAGATPATCPIPACASSSANSTTRSARSPRTTTTDPAAGERRRSGAV